MSDRIYILKKDEIHKPLAWLVAKPQTPPMTLEARVEIGYLLRLVQMGVHLEMPHSRPMTVIGKHCHELRVNDAKTTWRLFYRIDEDAIVMIDLAEKKTEKTTKALFDLCKARLAHYDL